MKNSEAWWELRGTAGSQYHVLAAGSEKRTSVVRVEEDPWQSLYQSNAAKIKEIRVFTIAKAPSYNPGMWSQVFEVA
jgi:hypothetical protein